MASADEEFVERQRRLGFGVTPVLPPEPSTAQVASMEELRRLDAEREAIEKRNDPYRWRESLPSERERTGALEAAGRGFAQEATLGLQDEASGVLGAALTKLDPLGILPPSERRRSFAEVAKEIRDEERKAAKQAREDQPGAYLASGAGGALLTSALGGAKGTGYLARGARALFAPAHAGGGALASGAKAALRAAPASAISAAGHSEADTAGGLARDIGLGAVAGSLASGAVTAIGAAAAKQIEKARRDAVLAGGTITQRRAIQGDKPEAGIAEFIAREKDLARAAARDPTGQRAAELAASKLDDMAPRIKAVADDILAQDARREARQTILRNATARDKLSIAGRDGKKLDSFLIKHSDLADLSVDPASAAEAARGKVTALHDGVVPAYDMLEKMGEGTGLTDVLKSIDAVAKKYDRPGQSSMRKAIEEYGAEFAQRYRGANVDRLGKSYIPIKEMRQIITDDLNKAFRGNVMDPTAAAEMRTELAFAVKDAFDASLEKGLAKRVPFSKKTVADATGLSLDKIKDANREMNQLIAFERTMQRRAMSGAGRAPRPGIDYDAAIDLVAERGKGETAELARRARAIRAFREIQANRAQRATTTGVASSIKGAAKKAIAAAPRALGALELAGRERGLRGGVARVTGEGLGHEARGVAIGSVLSPGAVAPVAGETVAPREDAEEIPPEPPTDAFIGEGNVPPEPPTDAFMR
jgi:hypothetical protein